MTAEQAEMIDDEPEFTEEQLDLLDEQARLREQAGYIMAMHTVTAKLLRIGQKLHKSLRAEEVRKAAQNTPKAGFRLYAHPINPFPADNAN